MDRMASICRAFLALLSVQPLHGPAPSNVNDLMNYKGADVLESSFRDALSGNTWWTKLWNELIIKGSGTVTLQPELDSLQQILDSENAQELSLSFLQQVAERLPYLKKNMRSGCTASFEKGTYKAVVRIASSLLGDKEKVVSGSYLEKLLAVLLLFRETPGVLQLLQKLEAYKKDRAVDLACFEVAEILKAGVKSCICIPPVPIHNPVAVAASR